MNQDLFPREHEYELISINYNLLIFHLIDFLALEFSLRKETTKA